MHATDLFTIDLDADVVSNSLEHDAAGRDGVGRGTLEHRSLGQILTELGCLRHSDIERVLSVQRQRGLRFGEAARKLRLVSKTDLQRALAIQFGYPCLQPGEGQLSAELVAAYRPFGPQGEALRELRSQLLLHCFNAENAALAIVGPNPNDGRSFAAANLAVAFAQWGRNTLLIDADLRSPRQHQLFNIDNRIGLSTVLRGRPLRDALQIVPYFGNLSVLPAGPAPPNPLELVGRPEFVKLLAEVQETYDIVLIDTPAANNSADAQVIAAQAGNALLIAREGVSRLEDLQELLDRVCNAGVQVVGAALNRY